LHILIFQQDVTNCIEGSISLSRLLEIFRDRPRATHCEFGFTVKIGTNLSRVSINGFLVSMSAEKPICFEDDNGLTALDFTGSHMPVSIPILSGFNKLMYLSLENTGIKKLPNEFLQYYPSLEVLKLSKVDIRHNMNEEFFGLCPTLLDIDLHSCNMTKIPKTTFSPLVNLKHLNISHNFLHSFDFYLQNCTNLHILNLSHNNFRSTSRKSTVELTKSNQIKSLFESGKSPYTQTHTCIHKTQYTIKEETMKL